MKNTLLMAIAIFATAGMGACKKDYTCFCNNSTKPATSYQFSLEHRTKKQATDECRAASNEDPTNQISCTINNR